MSDVPAWLDALVEAVAEAMEAHAPGPMGLRYRQEDGVWEVLVYLMPIEMVGGAYDGGVVAPGFSLDVELIRRAFTRLDALSWDAHPLDEGDGAPCVVFKGAYAGREVCLRVLAFAPEDEEPGMKLDTNRE